MIVFVVYLQLLDLGSSVYNGKSGVSYTAALTVDQHMAGHEGHAGASFQSWSLLGWMDNGYNKNIKFHKTQNYVTES